MPPGLEWVAADVADASAVRGLAEDCEVVVHLAAGRPEDPAAPDVALEGTRNVVTEAARAGSRRLVYVSALGAGAAPEAGSGRWLESRRPAESVVRSGAPGHVILRPSLVVGPDDHVVSALARVLRRGPLVLPAADGPAGVLQPAAVEDVAEALCQAVERPDLEETAHGLAGPDTVTPAELVRAVAARLSLARRLVRLPGWGGRRLARLADRTGLTAPSAMAEMRARALPEPVRDAPGALRRVFRLEPLPLAVALEDYL